MGQSNKVTWILAGGLVVAIVVIAFLLGKQSSAPVPAPPVAAYAPAAAPVAPVAPGAPSVPVAPVAAAPGGDKAALQAYFAQVESIQIGPAGDANSFAQQLITASLKGDTSDIDQLVRDLDRAESNVRAIAAPAAARAHHEALLGQISESKQMMAKIAKALGKGGDPSALSDMAGAARAMQAKAEVLEREEKALKQRAGLSPE